MCMDAGVKRPACGNHMVSHVGAPAIVLGELLDASEAPPHETADVRHQDAAAHERARPAKGHGEANFIAQLNDAAAVVDEVVIVRKGGKVACNHAVAEEDGRMKVFNQALVHLRQSELPALPADGVSIGDMARCAALRGLHPEHLLYEFDACGEQEEALDGSSYCG